MKFSSHGQWKLYGEKDPYFGVLSEDKFRNENLNEESIEEFYKTGEAFIEEVENRISGLFGESLENKTILDFGCGVGRLTVAFSRKSTRLVLGVDIAEGMLSEARAKQQHLGIKNIQYTEYDGFTLPSTDRFSFINSYIVFQHIEPKYGYQLLEQLCEKLEPGGIAHLQLTYGQDLPKITYWNFHMRTNYSAYNFLYCLLRKGKFVPEPVMQMNHYKLDQVFKIFARYTSNTNVEFTNHGGHLGAIFCFRRDK